MAVLAPVMTATNDNGMVVQTSQADLHLLHVPRQTRYNQNEVAMNDISLAENDQTSVSFGNSDGVGMPMEYRSTSNLCTYIHTQGAEMDAVDKSMDDHDKVCDPTAVASSGTLYGSCTVSNAHKVLCLPHDATRGQVVATSIYDMTMDFNTNVSSRGMFLPTKAAAKQVAIELPDTVAYHPPGQNDHAGAVKQWYSIVPKANPTQASVVDNVWFCKSTADSPYHPNATYGGAASGSDHPCNRLSVFGDSQDTIVGNGVSVVTSEHTGNSGQNGMMTLMDLPLWIIGRRKYISRWFACRQPPLKANADFNLAQHQKIWAMRPSRIQSFVKGTYEQIYPTWVAGVNATLEWCAISS